MRGKRPPLFGGASIRKLAHHKTGKLFDGHFLAVEVHLIVGVVQLVTMLLPSSFASWVPTAMLPNMSAVAVAWSAISLASV